MTEPEEVKPRPRRTRQEVQRLVTEFVTSGPARAEFCRIHGMTLGALKRGLKRARIKSSDIQSDGKRLVRVKITGGSGRGDLQGPCAMAVVLVNGRRIELNPNFDLAQLRRVVETPVGGRALNRGSMSDSGILSTTWRNRCSGKPQYSAPCRLARFSRAFERRGRHHC